MRIAIVFFATRRRAKLIKITDALASGIASQGHQVDIIDGIREINTKLAAYEYIAVGTESNTFWSGKISNKVSVFMRSTGMIIGKPCFAYVLKRGLFSQRALMNLMNAMEHEGMNVHLSEVISNVEEAREIGERLHVIPNPI